MVEEIDEKTIRQYLLGELTEAEMSSFEERLMTDDKLFELLLFVEDELIDERAEGELSAEEQAHFDAYFLTSPQRRERLQLAYALHDYADRHADAPKPVDNPDSGASNEPTNATPSTIATEPEVKEVPSPAPVIHLPRRLSPSQYVILAAAAVILIAVGLDIGRIIFPSDVDKGLAALNNAYRQQRPTEARITSFDYAPWSETRGNDSGKVNTLERDRAKLMLLNEAAARASAQSYDAAGRVYLAERQFDEALTQFNQALQLDANNAQLHNDIGATYLEKGKADKGDSNKSLEDFARSLEHLSRALELNNSLLEARFNRALLYQHMMLPQQAEEDWHKYLKQDPSSHWADEANHYLRELEEQRQKRSQSREESLQEFLAAYHRQDAERAWAVFSHSRETATGRFLTEQLLESYLELSANGRDEAQHRLQSLFYAGYLEQQKTGDDYALDLANYYQSASPARRAALAQAHTFMKQGRQSYTQGEYSASSKFYSQAKEIFDRQKDVGESLLVGLRIAQCQLQSAGTKECLATLPVLIKTCEQAKYEWLRSQFLIMTGRALSAMNDYSKTITRVSQALQISERINDHYSVQKSLAFLALEHKEMGNLHASLAYLERCLFLTGSDWAGARQSWRNYDTASQVFMALAYPAAAAAFEKEALLLAVDEIEDPSFTYVSYVNLGVVYGSMQQYAEAIRYAQLGYDIGKAFSTERSGKQMMAYSNLQLGYLHKQAGNYDQSLTYYNESLALCSELDFPAYAYDAHKGRLLCWLAQGDDAAASEELQVTLNLFEQHRSRIIDESSQTIFFDSQQSIYDLAIDFEASRMNNRRRAFEYSETSRARSLLDLISTAAKGSEAPINALDAGSKPLALEKIQQALPDEAQILQYAVLEDKLLIWVVTKDQIFLEKKEIAAKALIEKVIAYWQLAANVSESTQAEARQRASELYAILIAPVEPLLDPQKELCIVPDKALVYLPFGALCSPENGDYLASHHLIVYSPSATLFLHCTDVARRRDNHQPEYVLSVGDPIFNHQAFNSLPDLPASAREAQAVRQDYELGRMLVRESATKRQVKDEMIKADVVDFASHYVVNESSPLRSGLLLTKESTRGSSEQDSDGILQAGEVYCMKLQRTRLVVLSACRTGVEGYYKGEGMIGMSRAFMVAGVPLIVASLWPVDSNATAQLIEKFHAYRKHHGLSTVAALQHAQLDLINSADPRQQQPFYWAPFVVIGGCTKI